MSRKQRVLSQPAAAILRRFLDAPDDELHGFQIIRETGIPSGTLYPALRTLAEQRGLLTSRREDVNELASSRPPRRLYKLKGTAEARAEARDALAEYAAHNASRPRRRIGAPGTVKG